MAWTNSNKKILERVVRQCFCRLAKFVEELNHGTRYSVLLPDFFGV
jgi:hypothetical protein